jgi:ribosomal protein S12 methylthiotransferase accessory factor
MGIRAGVTLIELAPDRVAIRTRRGFIELGGLSFSATLEVLTTGAGGRVQFARALSALAPASTAVDVARQLGAEGLFAAGTTSLVTRAGLRRIIGPAARLRIGPLQPGDHTRGGPLVHLTARGWRISGAQSCVECATLWEIQEDRAPHAAARIANARARRCAIALGPADGAHIAAALPLRCSDPRWIAGRYGSVGSARRALPPAAACARCSELSATERLRATARTLDDTARLARRALRRFGVATREEVIDTAAWRLPIMRITLVAAVLHRGAPSQLSGRRSVQLGVGASAAEQALIGRAEVIERASAMLRAPDVRAVAASSLAATALPIAQWALYSAEQYALPDFPYPEVDARTPLDWVWAQDAWSGERLLVPAALTMTQRLTTARFVDATSNGVATHTDREVALRSALLEVIERDALQRAWYLGRGARPLSLAAAGVSHATRAALSRAGWQLRLCAIAGRAELYVVVAIAERVADRAPFARGGNVLAAAAGGELAATAARAVRELRMVVDGLAMTRLAIDVAVPPRLDRFWDVENPIDIAHLYLHPAMRPVVHAFAHGPAIRARGRVVADDVRSIVHRLHGTGHRTLVVDLSVPRTAPFVTVQALVLGSQPLGFGTGMLRLGSGVLPRGLPSRNPPLPRRGFRVPPGQLNPYVLPLS